MAKRELLEDNVPVYQMAGELTTIASLVKGEEIDIQEVVNVNNATYVKIVYAGNNIGYISGNTRIVAQRSFWPMWVKFAIPVGVACVIWFGPGIGRIFDSFSSNEFERALKPLMIENMATPSKIGGMRTLFKDQVEAIIEVRYDNKYHLCSVRKNRRYGKIIEPVEFWYQTIGTRGTQFASDEPTLVMIWNAHEK